MKGNYPKAIYILITLLGVTLLILNTLLELPIAASAIGAGFFAYGVNRLIGEWRFSHDPDFAKKLELSNKDERLAFIADKSRSATLIITIIVLTVLGIILLSFNLDAYGNVCLYIICGISVVYFIVYQIFSRRF